MHQIETSKFLCRLTWPIKDAACDWIVSSWLHWIRRSPAISNMAGQEDPVQREIHQDWANREYIEVITSSIKKIADFLNSFGKHLR